MKKACFILTFSLFIFSTFTTVDAQNFSFGKPIRLGTNINSEAEESMPIYNEADQRLYFVRTFHEYNNGGKLSGQDIWYSEMLPGYYWNPAKNDVGKLNNNRNNAIVGTNGSTHTYYLIDAYSANQTKLMGIAEVKRGNTQWTDPKSIKIPGIEVNNNFVGFYVHPNGRTIIISMERSDSYGEEDLYFSLLDSAGNWSYPKNLGPTINTTGFEISPYITDDGSMLFFASDGHPGFGGSDIFISEKLYDSWVVWSKPVNLGDNVNSSSFDAYLTLSDDRAYFVSNRSAIFSDIYTCEYELKKVNRVRAMLEPDKYQLSETEIQELMGVPIARNIYFEFESFEVEQSSRELIYFLANKLFAQREYNIELIGHTDKEGSDEYNLELSQNRADEVAKFFEQYGINSLRISTKGVGENRPLYKEGTEEELAKNRRVEIIFTK